MPKGNSMLIHSRLLSDQEPQVPLLLFKIVIKRKEKGIHTLVGEEKLSLLADDMILYVENHKDHTPNHT